MSANYKMKILSLFDGISCGRVALERAGLHVSRYVAYEINQDAINVSNWNWPGIEHKGTVEGADFTQYRGFDMVIGGFPCTDLSIGKSNRKGLAGKHSRLFWEQVRAIKEVQPRYFLVENNYRMPKKDETIITETLGVKPILINSALVSAQNRNRLYWTNIPHLTKPDDRGVMLADILEERVPLKYYHMEGSLDYLTRGLKNSRFLQKEDNEKSNCLLSVYAKGVPYNALAVKPLYGVLQRPRGFNRGGVHINKSPTITSNSWQHNNLIIYRGALKSYCLTASYANTHITRIYQDEGKTQIYETGKTGVPLLVEDGLLHYKERKIPVKLSDGLYAIRKLTPVECERLQTLPDGYTEMVSDTQRYRQLGNGWTVEVIVHIFNHIHLDNLI